MASATENRYVNVYVNNKGVKGTYNELRKEAFKLRAELNSGKLTQDEFNRKVRELQSTEAVLKKHRDSIRGVNNSWRQLKQIMLGVVGGNVILGVFQKLTQFIPNLISKNAELADSFTDVQKTTGLSAEGVEDLNQRLGTIDTRTARSRLLELARDAGKLGITGVENITQFVKAADQIEVALGEDLGDGAITQLGKLNNLFGASEIFGYEQGLLKLGSVINELGANSEASEGAIVDFTSRLAGVADQADLTFDQIAGIGATLDSLGQRTETSSTAISQAIVGMFSDTETYAKIAGVGLEEFSQMLETDANEAFVKFLEGLNGNNEGLTAMSKKFDDLGIDGSRAITVLGALSGNTDQLRKQQELANRAFDEGISLTNEFSQKNENAAGNLEKIQRAINKLWVNSSLKKGIDDITRSLARMIEVPVSQNLEEQRMRFNGLMQSIMDTNTSEEDRLTLIRQLNESYGDRLGGMDLEKASLGEIETAMRRVNDQYLIEIALQKQKERLDEARQEVADKEDERLTNQVEANKFLAEANNLLGESYDNVADAIDALQGRAAYSTNQLSGIQTPVNDEARLLKQLAVATNDWTQSQRRAKIAREELNDVQQQGADILAILKEEYPEMADLIDRMNAGVNGVAPPPTPTTEPKEGDQSMIDGKLHQYKGGQWVAVSAVSPGDPETQDDQSKEQEKYQRLLELINQEEEKLAIARLEGREKELAEIDAHYDQLLEKAAGHAEEELKIEELRQQAKADLELKYQQERDLAQGDIDSFLAGMEGDAVDPEVAAMEAKFDEMIELAKEFNLDTVELEEARAKAIMAVRERLAQEESQAELEKWRRQMAILDGAANDIMRGLTALNQNAADENSRFAKFQQQVGLVTMGVSAGVAVANAIKSASTVPWPGNLAAMASAIGAVMGFIGQARRVFGENSEVPEYALGTMNARGGGIAGDQGRELIPPTTVIPANITQDILAANTFQRELPQPNFSMINDGLNYSQSQQVAQSGISSSSQVDLSPLIGEMRAMREELQRSSNKRVVLSQRDYDEFTERRQRGESRVRITSR